MGSCLLKDALPLQMVEISVLSRKWLESIGQFKAAEQPTKASSAQASVVTIQVMPDCVDAVLGGVGADSGGS